MRSTNQQTISIILPCLNEAAAIPTCLPQLQDILRKYHYHAEVIVVDNGSTDESASLLAEARGTFPELQIIHEHRRGYGSAYNAGLAQATGTYIVMVDMDNTYDFSEIPKFVDALSSGATFVIGNRFQGDMERDSMPWHHRWIGNPILSLLVRILFGTRVRDVHCGMRALHKDILPTLNLQTPGMEFASEMVVKAVREKCIIAQIPITYSVRIGTSKLRSFADGWRHLRFILLYSPLFIFLLPGSILFLIGLISMIILYFNQAHIFGIQFVVHPIFISSLCMIVGFQLMTFAGFAKAYAVTHLREDRHIVEKAMKYLSIEKASILGLLGVSLGLVIFGYILAEWIQNGFGSLNEIKNAVVGLTIIVLSIQMISAAFMTSILGIKEL